MEQLLGKGWKLFPAGGVTGEAFLAVNSKQKLFLKRNSSPFLAILSAEGIVPKLLWTKRLGTGDVYTAQEWLEGRKLQPDEIEGESVAKLLSKIHTSQPLLNLLKQIEREPFQVDEALLSCAKLLETYPSIQEYQDCFNYMEENLEFVKNCPYAVCHGDLNHHNFMVSSSNQMYLVDWDQTKVADCTFDLAYILIHYVPLTNWKKWIKKYGLEWDEKIQTRIVWYCCYWLFVILEQRKKQGLDCGLALRYTPFSKIKGFL